MSFLTPKHFQDASRVLRGLALVAAKAAVDSPLFKQAGRTDVRAAVQETLERASRQSAHVAQSLQQAAREGSRDPAEAVRRGIDGSRQATEAVTAQLQGVLSNGERMLSGVLRDGERLFNETAQGAGPLQQGLRQVDQWMQQGRAAMEGATSAGQQGASSADVAASTAVRPPLSGAQDAAVELAHASADAAGAPIRGATHRSLQFWVEGGQAVLRPGGNAIADTLPAAAAPSSGRTSAAVPDLTEPATAAALVPAAPPSPPAPVVPLPELAAGPLSAAEAVAAQPETTVLPSSMHQPVAALQTPQIQVPLAEPVIAEPAGAAGTAPERGSMPAAEPAHIVEARAAAAAADERRRFEEQRAAEQLVAASKEETLVKQKAEVRRKLRERRVPSSPIGRVFGFAQLGASLAFGTMSDSVSQYFRGGGDAAATEGKALGNRYLTEANASRLADALCRMRGAALKLGQMLSIQDENVLPPQLTAALERVRAGADIMPKRQLEKVLVGELGPDWASKFADFEYDPLAAASIGQVHRATLHDGRKVVLKIQYPGVARSIESDVDNLLRIITYANFLPKGLYVEAAAKVAKRELALECDYSYEARCQSQFRKLIAGDPTLAMAVSVPYVVHELSTPRLLTSEWVPGVHIDKVAEMGQEVRDAVGTTLLQLTLKELFQWRFMQTDPNWGNFLYDEHSRVLHLIDFGAAREYPQGFVDDYLRMVRACAERDRTEVILRSTRMGFLTGEESEVMLDAHAEAGYAVGTPFASPGAYDFASHGPLTRRVSDLGAVMLRHRLTAPPEEAYSLHRKLAGAYLACIKLRAHVPCRQLFYDQYERHVFGATGGDAPTLPQQAAAA